MKRKPVKTVKGTVTFDTGRSYTPGTAFLALQKHLDNGYQSSNWLVSFDRASKRRLTVKMIHTCRGANSHDFKRAVKAGLGILPEEVTVEEVQTFTYDEAFA